MASSVVLIQGTEEFLVLRRIRDLTRDHQERGYEVQYYDASEPDQVSEMRSSSGMGLLGSPQKTLAVVQNPHKLDVEWVSDLANHPDDYFSMILHVKGSLAKNTKLYKSVVSDLESRGLVLQIDQPDKYKLEGYAVQFLQQELSTMYGKVIDEALSKAVVRRAGTDLGVLSFEAWKISMLETESKVSIDTVRDTVSTLSRVEIDSLINAITTRNPGKVLKTLERMKSTWSSDPTMAICGMLTPVLLKWAKALSFEQMDISPKGAAEIMKVNAWYWENIVLVEARKIGLGRVEKMVNVISETQKAVRSGQLSPWILLETGFVSALKD